MIEWQNICKERQGFAADIGEQAMEFKLHFEVHHDTSYPFQSSAKVSVWNDETMTWNPVASYHYAMWAGLAAPEDGATEGIWEALNELRSRAVAILGVQHV